MRKILKAFTLAEVLLTLAIVGIVAALTIPTLLFNVSDSSMKAQYKTDFSEVSQAVLSIKNDNGTLKGVFTDANTTMNLFKGKMNISKSCYGDDIKSNCWHNDGVVKTLYGEDSIVGPSVLDGAMITSRGSLILTSEMTSGCSNNGYRKNSEMYCASFFIDVNGFKAPNTIGKDILGFVIDEHTVKPFNSEDCDVEGDDPFLDGIGCSEKYLLGD